MDLSSAYLQNWQRKERYFEAFESCSFFNSIICDRFKRLCTCLKYFIDLVLEDMNLSFVSINPGSSNKSPHASGYVRKLKPIPITKFTKAEF